MSKHTAAVTTRKGRIARLAGATAVAGLVAGGITLAAAPANANPATCPVPASATWHITGYSYPYLGVGIRLPRIVDWATTYNGVNYYGETHVVTYTPTNGPLGVCAPVGQPLPPMA